MMMDNNIENDVARKAIEELVKGREFANQLRQVMNGDSGDCEQLVRKVLMSFTNSLVILNTPSTPINPTKSEDSLESNCKTSIVRERRGCYKRRRNSQTWEKESEAPVDDGHQWRKYGQKVILNAKHPRNYYRCTHKYDQGCQATKQVQRVQDDPQVYKTTYYGHHTCRNLMSPEIILDSTNSQNSDSSVFLSFGNNKQQECTFLGSCAFQPSAVKKESNEDTIPSSSSNDYLLSSELTFDHNSSKHLALSPNIDSDDVISAALYDPADLDDAFGPFLNFDDV